MYFNPGMPKIYMIRYCDPVKKKIKFFIQKNISSVQFSSVAQSCQTLCNPINCSTPGLPVHHQLLGFIQTHAHRVGDAIQPSHPLLSPSFPAQDIGILKSIQNFNTHIFSMTIILPFLKRKKSQLFIRKFIAQRTRYNFEP